MNEEKYQYYKCLDNGNCSGEPCEIKIQKDRIGKGPEFCTYREQHKVRWEKIETERILNATIKPAVNDDDDGELHIECRTSKGTKNAFIVIDGERLNLARAICKFINENNPDCSIS